MKETTEASKITKRFLQVTEVLTKGTGRITQLELGERINISSSNINRIRADKTNKYAPSLETIALLCRDFNVSATWMITGEGDMFVDDKAIANFKSMHKQITEIEKFAADLKTRVEAVRKKVSAKT